MTARRSASLICAQVAISASVRPQPRQVPVAASSRQILTQGVSKDVPLGPLSLKECRDWRAIEQSPLPRDAGPSSVSWRSDCPKRKQKQRAAPSAGLTHRQPSDRLKQRNHSQSLLGNWTPSAHLTGVRNGTFGHAERTQDQPAKLKENPYEEARYRRRARYCLCQPRVGRRVPERLHDPLIGSKSMVSATITVFSPHGHKRALVPIPFVRMGICQNGKKRGRSRPPKGRLGFRVGIRVAAWWPGGSDPLTTTLVVAMPWAATS